MVLPAVSAPYARVKKVLALVMAFAMAFTMMATAGAAYTDQADIEATEAVEMLNALGVMTGDPDGAFRPNDTITRAEACRMIYTIRTGTDDASSYANMQTTFTDVSSDAWYAGYVKHCQSVGIVSGRSATIFDPNSDVTAVELALMCLRVMGYDPATANIGGSTWSTTTIGLATEAGILDDVMTTITDSCPRQWAAQIMYNTILASTVQWSTDTNSYTQYFDDGTKRPTVGREYLDLYINVGTLTTVSGDDISISMTASDEADSDNDRKDFTNLTTDYSSLLGQKVNVLFLDDKANGVIGVYPTEDNTVYTVGASLVEPDNARIKIDGTSYSLDGGTNGSSLTAYRIDVDGNETVEDMTAADFDDLERSIDMMTFVDNDGDGRLNFVSIVEYDAAEVTYASSSQIVAGETYRFAEENIAEDIERDDWVAISYNRFDDCKEIVRAEMLDGVELVATATDSNGNGTFSQYQIDDTWYNEWEDEANSDISAAVRAGDTVDAVVVNGIVVKLARSVAGGGVEDVALVLETGGTFDGDRVKIVTFDGDDSTVDFNDRGDVTSLGGLVAGTVYGINQTSSEYSFDNLVTEADYYNGFTYFTGTTSDLANDRVGTYTIDDTADVLVYAQTAGAGTADDTTDDAYDFVSLTGRQFKNLTLQAGTNYIGTVTAFRGDVNGLTRVAALAVEANNLNGIEGAGTSNYYGFILSTVTTASGNRLNYTIWTEDGERKVYEDTRLAGDRAKGMVIGYDSLVDNGDGTYTIDDVEVQHDNVYVAAVDSANSSSVQLVEPTRSYTDNDYAKVGGAELDIENSSTVLYVDTSNSTFEGVEGGTWNTSTTYASTVYVTDTTGTEIEWIVNDVTGQLDSPYVTETTTPGGNEDTDDSTTVIGDANTTAQAINDAMTAANTEGKTEFIIEGTIPGGNLLVPSGMKLTLNGNFTSATPLNIAGDGAVTLGEDFQAVGTTMNIENLAVGAEGLPSRLGTMTVANATATSVSAGDLATLLAMTTNTTLAGNVPAGTFNTAANNIILADVATVAGNTEITGNVKVAGVVTLNATGTLNIPDAITMPAGAGFDVVAGGTLDWEDAKFSGLQGADAEFTVRCADGDTNNLDIVIKDDVTLQGTGNLGSSDGGSLIIEEGVTVTVPSGTFLKLGGTVTVKGSIDVESDGEIRFRDDGVITFAASAALTNSGNKTVVNGVHVKVEAGNNADDIITAIGGTGITAGDSFYGTNNNGTTWTVVSA